MTAAKRARFDPRRMDSIRVRAVPGRAYPKPGGMPGDFVGLTQAPAGSPDAYHSIGDGVAYVASGPIKIANTAEIRRAIAKGDLEVVVDVEPEGELGDEPNGEPDPGEGE